MCISCDMIIPLKATVILVLWPIFCNMTKSNIVVLVWKDQSRGLAKWERDADDAVRFVCEAHEDSSLLLQDCSSMSGLLQTDVLGLSVFMSSSIAIVISARCRAWNHRPKKSAPATVRPLPNTQLLNW